MVIGEMVREEEERDLLNVGGVVVVVVVCVLFLTYQSHIGTRRVAQLCNLLPYSAATTCHNYVITLAQTQLSTGLQED